MEYKLDSHTHTLASGHAYNTILEMVQAASEKGLELLGITEHAPAMPGTAHEYYFANLKVMPRKINGIEVMFGSEVNIMDTEGTLDLSEELLKSMDVVIASMHIPCLRPGTKEKNTQALIRAMENPYVNIIGHPDDGRYPVDAEAVVRAARRCKVLLELNNASLSPNSFRMDARETDRKLLEYCRQYEVPIILNSDAHCCYDVGNHQYSGALVEEMGFPEELIVNRSVEEYKKYSNRR